ncbi:class I SAM-dependent methyltransferase [Bellilinea sp.]|jgi:SAM-dependent methyltransferase|uniref:class I SAM-dependent methyltransferase n=1 Tax=Bellilinea sp. TaxID=2838785 RepID=UPI002ADDEDA1|nr:class I SAM-dependent methyltransferase [Bellilinea sp.]
MENRIIEKAAERGVPSQVWRAGQERRLRMIREAAGQRCKGTVLVDGCGVGMYLTRLAEDARQAVGLDIEHERAVEAHQRADLVVCAAGEDLPLPSNHFDLVLSHEVLEHVQDDRQAVCEIVRVLKPGGRLVLFCPNRGYPFETHGIYWRGKYRFGNIPLVNYLPRRWRNRLAPHVRVYSAGDLQKLFDHLPVKFIQRTMIFGAYDNLIQRFGLAGKALRFVLQAMEKTPLRVLGLSHFWVVEKTGELD